MIVRASAGKLLVGAVLAYLVLSGNRGLWNLYKLHQEKKELAGEIARLKEEVDKYRSDYDVYERSLALLEKQAREELNLVRPGETIYRFDGGDRP